MNKNVLHKIEKEQNDEGFFLSSLNILTERGKRKRKIIMIITIAF